MYIRMVIGEAINEDQVREFGAIYEDSIEPEILKEPGIVGSEIMFEEGGTMVMVLTKWNTREDCLRYHSSRTYRQFVAKTQHLLVGNFVVKLFRSE